ncbi:Rrf2 family transcriptional regulator [Umezawaea beigongshangensis]|uniref:Rrf2 family transcriptional regulator n=1 Tax=Umezawaea beigongshangensis TaxID=2780383 RepID=UPI001E631EA3|nr:Rrf2 family transcriptional regulator [Umezawaea beigongshangensis]
MALSSRTAAALHALTLLARRQESLTSTTIAASMASNPVLVRRILGSLRDAGLVHSTEGRGGGWSLARAPREITLHDAYTAVEKGPVLTRHAHPASGTCDVGRHMHALLDAQFREAEQAMEERLGRTTVADLVQQVLAKGRELAHQDH